MAKKICAKDNPMPGNLSWKEMTEWEHPDKHSTELPDMDLYWCPNCQRHFCKFKSCTCEKKNN